MKTTKMLTILVVALGLVVCGTQRAYSGSIVVWGANGEVQGNSPPGNNYVAISGGGFHNLALKADGSIFGWGDNHSGQINIPAGRNFVAVGAGHLHSIALKSDGSIAGWGENGYGEATPPPGNDFVAIDTHERHNLALRSDGSIIGWGNNGDGQINVPDGNDFVAIAAGDGHSLALRSDGSIVGWGWNISGQATPPPGNDYVAIDAGFAHSVALKSDGSIVGWGTDQWDLANIPAGNDFVAISAGRLHNMALKADGSVVCWGNNESGQSILPDGNDFVIISGGWYHSLALRPVPRGTVFTYQGRLIDGNSPAEGLHDFEFSLYSGPAWGSQEGNTVTVDDVDVIDGYFTVELDFGEVFDGNSAWLEIGIRPGGSNDPNAFVTLSPRQGVTSTPYAIHAETARYVKSTDYANTAGHADTADYANTAGHANTADYANMAGSTATGITGSGTANHLPKFIDSNTVGDSAIYESGGNIGIGTTSPSHLLDVDGSLRLRQSGGGNPTASLIELGDRNGSWTYGINFNAYYDGGWKYRSSDEAAGIGFEDNGDLVFSTMAYGTADSLLTFSPRITIKENGNIGIGTTAPTQKLDVAGNIAVSGTADVAGNIVVGGTADVAGNIVVGGTVDAVDLSAHVASANAHHTPPTTLPPSGPAAGDLSGTYPNPSVVNDSHNHGNGTVSDNISINNGCLYALSGSGNVGIGLTTPTVRLDVVGDVRGNTLYANNWYDREDTHFYVNPDSISIFNDMRANIFYDRDQTAYYMDPASTGVSANFRGSVYIGNAYAYMFIDRENSDYYVHPGSTGTSATFAGNVGIGTSSPSGRLQVAGNEVRIGSGGTINNATGNGDLYVQDSLEVDGAVYMLGVRDYSMTGRDVMVESGSGRLGTLLSSKRFKENIVPLEDDFTKILEAQPVAFTWKESKEPDIGLIAEDMDELGLRNLVFYDAEGRPESVRYKFVSLYLLEVLKDQANSIKELKVENESLKEQLKTQNESVNKRLDALEKIIQQSQLVDVM